MWHRPERHDQLSVIAQRPTLTTTGVLQAKWQHVSAAGYGVATIAVASSRLPPATKHQVRTFEPVKMLVCAKNYHRLYQVKVEWI
jgi:hypothetical protein